MARGGAEQLQDYFRHTNWTLFEANNIDTYTSAVLFYVKNCMDNVIITKQIWACPNNKPWMTRDVCLLLKARNSVFYSGDTQQYSEARANLKRGIRNAKAMYRWRIEYHFESLDPCRAWQGLRHITRHNNSSSDSLAEQLNHFFIHFDVEAEVMAITSVPVTDNQPLILQPADVRPTL